jgi:hypothetical protein
MASCLLLVAALLAATHGQAPPSPTPTPVCRDITSGATTEMMKINDLFSVRIEVVAQDSNRVVNLRMFYSHDRNQIRLQQLDGGVRSDFYFYFPENEILTFDYSKGRGNCTVNPDLANSPETFIVGGSKDNSLRAPLEVFHLVGPSGFGSDIHLTRSTGIVRDMEVDSFNSCQKWAFGGASAIVNVTHHFSSKNWTRPDPPVVPVQIEIHGSAVIHGVVQSINNYYNFFDFQPDVDPTMFETPPGIMCQGRKVEVPFPEPPPFIKFSGETIDPSSGNVDYFEEIFSADDDFVVFSLQRVSNYQTTKGMDHQTMIRDYVSGLSYTLDDNKQTCLTQNITAADRMPFDFVNTQGKAQEVTPEQLFFNADAKFVHIGERTVRNILTDAWVAKTNIPSFPDEEVTLEWYFAKPEVTSWNSGSTYYTQGHRYRMPVLLRLWHNDVDLNSVDTHIYHVDYTKVMAGALNIRNCYPENQSNFFQIVLTGASQLVVSTNIEQFKWSTISILEDVAGVRWIRIVDMKVYYDADDAVIEFELLDAPPYASDISGDPVHANSLAVATQKINDAVKNGKLILKVWDSSTNDITKGIIASNVRSGVNSALPGSSDDSGYSAGSLAGLGVAMVIIGGAGGGVGAYFKLK